MPWVTDEDKVLDHLVMAWNAFLTLEARHPDDDQEFRQAIHAAQNIVMARAATGQMQRRRKEQQA
jgi:hypothetical protein